MQSIVTKYGKGEPTLVVVGCLHGDELVGQRIIDELAKSVCLKGSLKTIIANPAAVAAGKRFIDQDLNRSFPGNNNSKMLEERIAAQLLTEISDNDYVIDIHSTSSDTQDVVIIKKRDKTINQMIEIIRPHRVLLMSEDYGNGALVNFCSGISIEYGSHNSEETFSKSLLDIKKLMYHLGMIDDVDIIKEQQTEFYKVFGVAKKPHNFQISENVHNFVKINQGDILGYADEMPVLAEEDFYPVLFGEKAYQDIIGFKAKKI